MLAQDHVALLHEAEAWEGEALNMTYLALRFSGYVNGVAMRHGEVSRGMFPAYEISAITNGVHAMTWTSPAFSELFDAFIPGWRTDNNYLRYAISIPLPAIREAHAEAKTELFAEIARAFGVQLDPNLLTIGFARRASTYKRADLLFQDPERLRKIAREIVPMFYGRPNRYTEIMRFSIALNGSFFNTQRMVLQYIANAYKMNREVAVPEARV